MKKRKKIYMIGILLILVCLLGGIVYIVNQKEEKKPVVEKKEEPVEEVVEEPKIDLTISFAGDCTLGNYAGQGMSGTFNQEYINQGKDPSYFLKNVKEVFEKDDLTVVNLEGPITTASSHIEKSFPFSGKPEYTQILTEGSVEAVSLANNHSEDYYQVGLDDTRHYLDEASVGHFGYDEYYIKDIKGIRCGFLGYRSMAVSMNNEEGKQRIKKAITALKEEQNCQLVFVFYHWGIEREYYANEDQRSLAHFTIDAGGDGVIGSHPHVVQGQETYKGKPIIYSLGNFCFGGNKNPSDKDSMIFQLHYTYQGGKQLDFSSTIIPCSISSSTSRNDFQPRVLKGEEGKRVLDKIEKYSYQ